MRRSDDTEPDDAGYATLVALALMAVLVVVAGVLAAAASVVVSRHRAEAVADVAALSAAQHAGRGELAACMVALLVTEKNGATLESCDLDELDAVVVVGVELPGRAKALGRVQGRARAGRR